MQKTILRISISCLPLVFTSAIHVGCGGRSCEDTATCNVGDGDTSTGTGVGGSDPGTGGSDSGVGGSGGSGTGTATGTGSGTGAGTQTDDTPPTIESVTPSDGATGTELDEPLVIEFSEDMNKADTEGAFSSPDMGSLSFVWKDDRTLEVTGADLTYAQGTASVMANVYAWTLDTGAKDLAGNALLQEETGSFATLRHVTSEPPLVMQTSVNGSGSTGNCLVQGGGKFIGDRSATRCRVLLEYDLSGITSATEVVGASIGCSRKSVTGTPFADLGPVMLHHVDYNSSDLAAGFSAAPIGQSGNAFANASQVTMSVDVASAVATQIMATSPTLQLRLDFNQSVLMVSQTDRHVFFHSPSDVPSYGCEPDSLSVSYLVP